MAAEDFATLEDYRNDLVTSTVDKQSYEVQGSNNSMNMDVDANNTDPDYWQNYLNDLEMYLGALEEWRDNVQELVGDLDNSEDVFHDSQES